MSQTTTAPCSYCGPEGHRPPLDAPPIAVAEPVRINVYVTLTADEFAAFGDDHDALESAIAARLEELPTASTAAPTSYVSEETGQTISITCRYDDELATAVRGQWQGGDPDVNPEWIPVCDEHDRDWEFNSEFPPAECLLPRFPLPGPSTRVRPRVLGVDVEA